MCQLFGMGPPPTPAPATTCAPANCPLSQIETEPSSLRQRMSLWPLPSTASYGVPQFRERVFIVASRDGSTFRFPEPTHVAPDDHLLRILDAKGVALKAIEQPIDTSTALGKSLL